MTFASPLLNFFPIANDAIVLGLLVGALGLVFYTHSLPRFKKFYTFVPALLMCYFIPAALNSLASTERKATSTSSLRGTCCQPA